MTKLLIIEDEERDRQRFEKLFRSAGYEVVVYSSPVTAYLEVPRTQKVDKILVDWLLGVDDGVIAARKLQIQAPGVPVAILTSANADIIGGFRVIKKAASDEVILKQVSEM